MANEWDTENSEGDFILMGKDLERHFDLQHTLMEFSRLFRHDEPNDRAAAIVGAAFLDTLLEHLLVAFLVDDEKEISNVLRYDQPLGPYGNRVRMAYCLGLISKVIRDDLRAVAKVRNRFAHDLSASFEDKQISGWCTGLQWHRRAYMKPPDDATARELFHVGVNQLVCHLNGLVSLARLHKRRIYPDPA